MVVLIDTNILIDYITMREPFYQNAHDIVKLCADKKIAGVVAVHSIPNVYYILRKKMDSATRRSTIKALLNVLEIAGTNKTAVLCALDNEKFNDFEDCLQDESAFAAGADYIITRNIKDFTDSKVKAITPEDFLLLEGIS